MCKEPQKGRKIGLEGKILCGSTTFGKVFLYSLNSCILCSYIIRKSVAEDLQFLFLLTMVVAIQFLSGTEPTEMLVGKQVNVQQVNSPQAFSGSRYRAWQI